MAQAPSGVLLSKGTSHCVLNSFHLEIASGIVKMQKAWESFQPCILQQTGGTTMKRVIQKATLWDSGVLCILGSS